MPRAEERLGAARQGASRSTQQSPAQSPAISRPTSSTRASVPRAVVTLPPRSRQEPRCCASTRPIGPPCTTGWRACSRSPMLSNHAITCCSPSKKRRASAPRTPCWSSYRCRRTWPRRNPRRRRQDTGHEISSPSGRTGRGASCSVLQRACGLGPILRHHDRTRGRARMGG